MKTIYNWFFATVLVFFTSAAAFSQGILTGTVIDAEVNEPLPGASVLVRGTTVGTSTDFDGRFQLSVDQLSGILEISYIGFQKKNISFTVADGETKDLGRIMVSPNAEALEGVIVTGVVDVAKDRQTPVAVSTIKAAEIQEKLGTREFPEILQTTPSIYVTKQGGGFGDSRINIRGFDQRNTAVMINGVPVNDMENGWVYWSNWAGLSDVTSAIQVQRGLGSSKLAISSVGGTINVLTQTSAQREGGTISATLGNNKYMKFLAAYNTGLMESGFSASVLLSRTSGDGYVDGTKFEGYNYFLGLGYNPNENHALQFTYTGAPQWHHQRDFAPSIANYITYGEDGEPDRRYNSDWGYLRGEEFSWRRNFYHKPVMSLNWDWSINDLSSLSTVIYASWGRGGGSGPIGRINGTPEYLLPKTAEGLYDFDAIVSWNGGGSVPAFGADRVPDGNGEYINDRNNGLTRRASMNSHDWYGTVINYNRKFSDELSFDIGADLRTYKGIHYRVVNDILGADAYFDNRDSNNPNRILTPNQYEEVSPSWNPWVKITDQEKIEYYNDGLVRWQGFFGQLEYNNETVSAFVQFSGSNQGFKRIEYFNEMPPDQESPWENILGGNIKTGLNWNIDEYHNIFANAGYYSKQPLFDAVWINFGNNLNPNLANEKILGTEVGYGYRSAPINANLNLYRTSWKDRYISVSSFLDVNNTPGVPGDDVQGIANLYGVEQVHTGIELDFRYKPLEQLSVNGMLSYGSWQYGGDVTANYLDQDQQPILDGNGDPFRETLYLDGVKVGDAAQFTFNLGADYELIKGFGIDANVFHAGKLYADINPTDFNTENHEGSLQLPSYTLLNAGLSYKLGITEKSALNFRLNVNNVLDTLYISESETNIHAQPGDDTWDGVHTNNRVYFGFGRTWNLGLRYNF